MMTRIFGTAILASALVITAPAFAASKAGCCMKTAAHETNASCMNLTLADLNLTADQKQKIEKWQEECCKAGCTKESHAKFMSKAKGILSPEQYNKLKASSEPTKKNEA